MNRFRHSLRASVLAASTTIALSSGVAAEVIKIPIGEQHRDLKHISKPRRGQSKRQVEQLYGEPVQLYDARGTPPISRWEYPGFMVFFENDHVIHSVIKHRPNSPSPIPQSDQEAQDIEWLN